MNPTVKTITSYLESLAPRSAQENYDNSGLLVGDEQMEVSGVLVCLDSTEDIVNEALQKGCNLIVAHHPIVFKGLKSLTGKNYIERTVLACIRNGIALYAIHTNLDNYRFGVNDEIGRRLGLQNLRILAPKAGVLKKITVFVPTDHLEAVATALFGAGAGQVGNYSECSFQLSGTGTFKPEDGSTPFSGTKGTRSLETETRLEVIVSAHRLNTALAAMIAAHPYEEVAYDVYELANTHPYEGSGMIGELPESMAITDFLSRVKRDFGCGAIRYTKAVKETVRTVAFCGGSGSFLLQDAIRAKADVFITGDFKYHEFFDADNRIVIADIGHYESEQFTINLLGDILTKKFPNFAVRLTENNTNPINYL